jgi:hypothetical protein
MTKSEVRLFASWLGRRSYKVRLERFGIERLRDIARENGAKGGRPKKREANRKKGIRA